jgi:hypothetical protein
MRGSEWGSDGRRVRWGALICNFNAAWLGSSKIGAKEQPPITFNALNGSCAA